MLAPEKEFCDACSRNRDLREMPLNEHKTFGIRIRQRPQEHGVHYREDRAVDAKTESECEKSDDGKAWTFAEYTHSVAQVSPARLHERFPVARANGFLCKFKAAALQPNGAKGILATHALFHLFIRFHLQVGAQLLIQLQVDLILSEQ